MVLGLSTPFILLLAVVAVVLFLIFPPLLYLAVFAVVVYVAWRMIRGGGSSVTGR
jgi:hypothetical protein